MGVTGANFFLKRIKDLMHCLNNNLCIDTIKSKTADSSIYLAINDKFLTIYQQTTFSLTEFKLILEQLEDFKKKGDTYHIVKIKYINIEKLYKNKKQIDKLNKLIQGNK